MKWAVSQYLDDGRWGVVSVPDRMDLEGDGSDIIVGVSSRLTEQHARLIAAAPDLLDACKAALFVMGPMGGVCAGRLADAIKKAEGR